VLDERDGLSFVGEIKTPWMHSLDAVEDAGGDDENFCDLCLRAYIIQSVVHKCREHQYTWEILGQIIQYMHG
jgi:hypothetical protein